MQMRCAKTLDNTSPTNMIPSKTKLEEVAWSTIFLYIFKNLIRTIGETNTSAEIWTIASSMCN